MGDEEIPYSDELFAKMVQKYNQTLDILDTEKKRLAPYRKQISTLKAEILKAMRQRRKNRVKTGDGRYFKAEARSDQKKLNNKNINEVLCDVFQDVQKAEQLSKEVLQVR
jgi:hypothetical protein